MDRPTSPGACGGSACAIPSASWSTSWRTPDADAPRDAYPSTIGERQLGAQRDEGTGEGATHPRQHPRARDHMVANRGGEQAVDGKRAVSGTSVSVGVCLEGWRITKKKKYKYKVNYKQ